MITLLQSGITGESYELPDDFDLEQAHAVAKRHHITNQLYVGACNCGISQQDPTMQVMFQEYCVSTVKSEMQYRDLKRVMAAFDEHGIEYMPLKGSKLKAMYPAPEMRYMGDADILIRMEQYEQIAPMMESLGFVHSKTSDHEIVWRSKALYLELHKRLIPSYNKDFYAYFGEGWKLAQKEAGTRYTMGAEDEMIYLFTHFAKHYRDGGIGCRYVVDLWLFRNAHPELKEEYIHQELDQIGLSEFYDNIMRLIGVWFDGEPSDEKMDFMTEFIFASGSWGVQTKRLLSTAVKSTQHMAGRGGRIVHIFKTMFPGAGYLYGKYPVLKKKPWLLPAVWVIRPFRKVLFERESLKVQKEKLKLIKKENIEDHKKMLNYVGLNYNF